MSTAQALLGIAMGKRYMLVFEFSILSMHWTRRGALARAEQEGLHHPEGNNLIKVWGRNRG